MILSNQKFDDVKSLNRIVNTVFILIKHVFRTNKPSVTLLENLKSISPKIKPKNPNFFFSLFASLFSKSILLRKWIGVRIQGQMKDHSFKVTRRGGEEAWNWSYEGAWEGNTAKAIHSSLMGRIHCCDWDHHCYHAEELVMVNLCCLCVVCAL